MKLNTRISAKPGKQRKTAIEAHLNERRKFLHSRLSKELSKQFTRRNALVRKNDTVKISRGQFKGKSGKINRVDIKASRVFIDGIGFTKNDGSKVFYPVHASNLVITELDEDDKIRMDKLSKLEKKESKKKK